MLNKYYFFFNLLGKLPPLGTHTEMASLVHGSWRNLKKGNFEGMLPVDKKLAFRKRIRQSFVSNAIY